MNLLMACVLLALSSGVSSGKLGGASSSSVTEQLRNLIKTLRNIEQEKRDMIPSDDQDLPRPDDWIRVYDMVNKSYAVGLKTPIKDAPHDLVVEIYNYAYKLLIPSKLCRGITFLIQVMDFLRFDLIVTTSAVFAYREQLNPLNNSSSQIAFRDELEDRFFRDFDQYLNESLKLDVTRVHIGQPPTPSNELGDMVSFFLSRAEQLHHSQVNSSCQALGEDVPDVLAGFLQSTREKLVIAGNFESYLESFLNDHVSAPENSKAILDILEPYLSAMRSLLGTLAINMPTDKTELFIQVLRHFFVTESTDIEGNTGVPAGGPIDWEKVEEELTDETADELDMFISYGVTKEILKQYMNTILSKVYQNIRPAQKPAFIIRLVAELFDYVINTKVEAYNRLVFAYFDEIESEFSIAENVTFWGRSLKRKLLRRTSVPASPFEVFRQSVLVRVFDSLISPLSDFLYNELTPLTNQESVSTFMNLDFISRTTSTKSLEKGKLLKRVMQVMKRFVKMIPKKMNTLIDLMEIAASLDVLYDNLTSAKFALLLDEQVLYPDTLKYHMDEIFHALRPVYLCAIKPVKELSNAMKQSDEAVINYMADFLSENFVKHFNNAYLIEQQMEGVLKQSMVEEVQEAFDQGFGRVFLLKFTTRIGELLHSLGLEMEKMPRVIDLINKVLYEMSSAQDEEDETYVY